MVGGREMVKRIVMGIMFVLLLTSIFILKFTITAVNASGTIYIRADGNIYPPTANITSMDNITYVFTDNNYDGIVVERNHIVIDGAGYTLQGTGTDSGIVMLHRNNVTVKNTEIKGFLHGIHVYSSNNSIFIRNNITGNIQSGFLLIGSDNNVTANNITSNGLEAMFIGLGSDNNIIDGNEVAYNGYGIGVGSPNNTITGNNLRNNGISLALPTGSNCDVIGNTIMNDTLDVGGSNNRIIGNNITAYKDGECIWLAHGTNNSVSSNNLLNGSCGLYVWSSNDNNITGNNITNNTVDGIWLHNSSDNSITSNGVTNNFYGIRLYESSNNSISTNYISNSHQGLLLDSSNRNQIFGNNITTIDDYGIRLSVSSNNSIIDNNITESSQHGIYLSNAEHNTIYHNHLRNNDDHAIVLARSSYNVIEENIIVDNERDGVWFTINSSYNIIANNSVFNNGWEGIGGGYDSKHNLIYRNIIRNCSIGVYFDHNNYPNTVSNNFISSMRLGVGAAIVLDQTKNVTVSNNTCLQNEIGMIIGLYSSDNIIYHNNFINNTEQVEHLGPSYVNCWDDGYPSGGNYWSDYNDTDLYSRPFQNETGSDGIGDTPYFIDVNNTDNYPLMKPYPWNSHDIAVTSVEKSKTVIGQGFNMTLGIMLFNYGAYTVTTNLTVYADTTIMTSQNVTMTSKNCAIIFFTWSTINIGKGNYTITANATTVPGEIDISDNAHTVWIIVAMIGDITGQDGWPDGECDMRDVGLVARHFGQNSPPASANCDLTGPTTGVPDGTIDMRDVGLVARHFGETDP